MTKPRSIGSIARYVSVAALLVAVVGLRGERPAEACSGGEWWIGDTTTFDPGVLGVPAWDGVYYEPGRAGFGGYQPEFGDDALLADWRGYLKGAVTDADWKQVLFAATPSELATLAARLAGKAVTLPTGYEKSSLWSTPAAKDRLAAAITFVRLARAIEPSTAFTEPFSGTSRPLPTAKLLADATVGVGTADPFLAQRYAFQAVRIYFYQHDFARLITFIERHASKLAGPSATLHWRSRYYLAGALAKSGKVARANVELAHIHANYPPLSGAAATDFHPQNDADWRDALKLAATARDKAELWRLVGVKFDGLAAIQEILRLDVKSDLFAVLVVRELARAEDREAAAASDPAVLAKQHAAYRQLEQVALKLAALPGADRPWLMNLVAGHIAAKRGDLATARPRLQAALRGRPNDPRVASQAKASLALALVANWRIDEAHETELAKAMNGLDKSYGRTARLTSVVRDKLAPLYAAANQLVEAELLHPGTVDPGDASDGFAPHPGKLHWADVAFIKAVIARLGKRATDFDTFVVSQDALQQVKLEQELGLRYALDGDFATAWRIFDANPALSQRLEVDPFVTHIKDCRECDEQRYATSTWTHGSVIAKLAELATTANGTGEAAAEASIQIGNALYNFTWYGNARRVLRYTHQDSWDARPAERWYKRAYELTKSKELKAKAAYLAAKAERGNLADVAQATDGTEPSVIAVTWFSRLKQLANTRYYKEVLRECSTFASWVHR